MSLLTYMTWDKVISAVEQHMSTVCDSSVRVDAKRKWQRKWGSVIVPRIGTL